MSRKNKRQRHRRTSEGDGTAAAVKGPKENLYDKIPLTLTQLNVIIAVLIVLLVVAFVVGVLKGSGVR